MARAASLAVVGALIGAVAHAAAPPANLVGNPDPKVLSGVWTAQMLGGPPPGAGRQGGPPGAGPAGGAGPGPGAGGPPPGAGPGGPAGGPPPGLGGPPAGPSADPGRGSPVVAAGRGGRVAPVIKSEYLAQFPQGTLAPQQDTLRNNDASMLCVPDGYYGTGGGYPNLIIQTASQITIINEENHRHRRIYLDRQHPKNITPSYAGHSIGHWEGDTLVVNTIGFRERDGVKLPPNYSVTERFHKINDGKQMEYSLTFSSDAYSKPGTTSVLWTFRPDLHIQEEVCEQFSDNFNDDYFKAGKK